MRFYYGRAGTAAASELQLLRNCRWHLQLQLGFAIVAASCNYSWDSRLRLQIEIAAEIRDCGLQLQLDSRLWLRFRIPVGVGDGGFALQLQLGFAFAAAM